MERLFAINRPKHVSASIASLLVAASSANAAVSVIQNSGDLDLSGTFAYAVNLGGGGDGDLDVDGVTFNAFDTNGDVAGVSTSPAGMRTFPGTAGFWNIAPALGGDADINTVVQSLMDADNGGMTDFDLDLDASSGQDYKLQIILMERFFQADDSRLQTVTVDGVSVADRLDPYKTAVTDASLAEGDGAVVITHEFTSDGIVDIGFQNVTSFAIVSAVTLEVVPEPASLMLLGLGGLTLCRRRAS